MPTTLQFETINSHQPVTLDLQQKTCTLLPSDDDRTMQIVTGEIIVTYKKHSSSITQKLGHKGVPQFVSDV